MKYRLSLPVRQGTSASSWRKCDRSFGEGELYMYIVRKQRSGNRAQRVKRGKTGWVYLRWSGVGGCDDGGGR